MSLAKGADALFHIVVKRTPGTWDAIRELVETQHLPLITSENRPPNIAPQNWCKYVLARNHPDGRAVANTVVATLTGDDNAAMAMIDELATGDDLLQKLAAAARILRTEKPELRGLWGAFVTGGPNAAYDTFNQPGAKALDELLKADAPLALQFYPRYRDYCEAGAVAGQRDRWLGDYFRGERGSFPQRRLRWLRLRRNALRSKSRLTVMFPTTDTPPVNYLGKVDPITYLDRLFYAWATRSAHRSMMFAENGGIGTYKWDEKVSDPDRDGASWSPGTTTAATDRQGRSAAAWPVPRRPRRGRWKRGVRHDRAARESS